MWSGSPLIVLVASILFFTVAAPALLKDDAASQSTGRDIAREGKYIVENVAMCVQCHTPRNKSGDLIREEYLNGAPVPVEAPPYPQFNWALRAPAIAGLIGYTTEQGVRLLTAGVTRDGRVPSPPMPPFRMTVRDAQAVVAYLKSLE
jgi:mono/diheme cytochrome c family protein